MPSVPPTLGLVVLDRRERAAATSTGRGWPCRPGEGPVMPSVPLTLGLAVLDCWGVGGGHATLGPAVLDRWQGAVATSAGRGRPFRLGRGRSCRPCR